MENRTGINNDIYESLGERWYTAFDDPVALLRQESKVKIPWVILQTRKLRPDLAMPKLLDIGCGGGFLSNALAQESFQVTGVDLSEESLNVARKYDRTGQVEYKKEDAYQLSFPDQSFDVVTAMDFLEHVENPEKVIGEIARVLRPGGLFFFHTFNRNWLAKWIVIKGVEWFVKNTPPHMHVIELFIKPEELKLYCAQHQMEVVEMTGIKPNLSTVTFKGLWQRTVPAQFSFSLTKSLQLSYMGVAIKTKFVNG